MSKTDFLEQLASRKSLDRTARVVADTDDPQEVFCLDKPLGHGWYWLQAEIGADGAIDPQVFFDFGGGFSEVFSVRLKPTGKGDLFAITVRLPQDAASVRLDPMSRRGEYRIGSFTAERLSASRLAAHLATYGLTVLKADPRGFAARLPLYVRALTKPHFLRLGDPSRYSRGGNSYQTWIVRHDFNEQRDAKALQTTVDAITDPPLISVVMPVYNTPEKLLRAAIDSVLGQIYANWQLCIADDFSTMPHVRAILADYALRDSRIKVTFRQQNGHISAATNSAFELAEGDWIALLDHDDVLRPNALAEVALEIVRYPEAELIYSDEDKLDTGGNRYDPYFKPDFSRELFRSQNYLNHLTVHRAANVRAAGGWRTGFEGSQDYDISLRILERIDPRNIRHIPKVLYHWRAAEGSTAASGGEKSYAYDAGMRALKDHVARSGLAASVEAAPDTPFYRLRFAVPDPAPLVSLIIPTRDKVELLRGCIGSIMTKTTYPNYEIIVVDNGSTEPATLAYLTEIARLENVRVLSWDKPFNYSAINNFAVLQANGEIIGLVNNDIEVISPDWLREMVSWAAQEDVGCVGAKLYYANDTIQHAGVILGLGGVAGHSHKYFPRDHPGYFFRLKVTQNLSAVTAACLLVRKAVFQAVGGLNEKDLMVAFNDVDLCLRVHKAGYANVWTPYAELYHLESISRGPEDSPEKLARFESEKAYMKSRWDLWPDPCYSPHLTRDREDFSIG
jgi:glycosyltransferase involved in cell wall biosynthesis